MKNKGYRRFQPILALSSEDLHGIARAQVVDAVETAFKELALHNVIVPEKLFVKVPSGVRYALMSAYVGGSLDAFGAKILGTNLENPAKRNLPGNVAAMTLSDPRTGELIALMEGSAITAMRTAACCAVATKYMARPDSEVLGVFGAGLVGEELLRAICQVRKIKKIKLFDLPELYDKCASMCNGLCSTLGVEAIASRHPREVVEGSNIICTATTSKEPVFKASWLAEGTHINSVGIAGGTAREIEDNVIEVVRKPIVVDIKEHMLKEGLAADVLVPISKGLLSENDIIDLADVVVGKKMARGRDNEITLFKSGGSAIGDVAVAKAAYDLAGKRGIGTTIQL